MKKVLILQNKILHYRKPFYNKLAEKHNVTVLHSGKKSRGIEDKYEEIITPIKSIGKLIFQKGVLKEVKSGQYDTVIAMMDIFWIYNVIASFIYPKKTKFIWWGIIVSKNNMGNKLRALFLRKLPTIFYTEAGMKTMKELGYSSLNYTFCNNTFHIENRIPCYLESEKNTFLFVGSLDKRKKIDVLLNAFNNAIPHIPNDIILNIIGDGEEFELAKNLIENQNLKNRVFLIGKVTETTTLQEYYRKALFSVSFGQAGLGVLQSLGYGVPFITNENAISGGEINNINHEENGIICEESQEDLTKYLIRYSNNTKLAKLLGEKAFEHYSNHATIDHMTGKFNTIINV